MSSNSGVTHGLQSCLDTIVTHPTVLMNPLPLNTPNHCQNPSPENSKNLNQGKSWNFILALTSNSFNNNNIIFTSNDSDQILTRRSGSSSMSKPSLEMCTESLGSETGTCIDSIMDELSNPEPERPNFTNLKTLEHRKMVHKDEHVGSAIAVRFPPPLTSVHGRYCVHLLQVHREDGRLVISASRFPSCRACFKSKREDGRLTLSVIRDGDRNLQAEMNEAEFNISEQNQDEDVTDSTKKSRGENPREEIGGKLGLGDQWSSNIRCNGDDHQNASKGLPSFPIYVAMS